VQKGSTITSLAQEYGVPRSTVANFWQQREKIMSARVSVGAMKISDKNRSSINEETEKLLITWIKERQMKGDPVTPAMIYEKARLIFEELQKKTPGSTSNKTEEFKAS
jgi:transposase-like protein